MVNRKLKQGLYRDNTHLKCSSVQIVKRNAKGKKIEKKIEKEKSTKR